MPITPIRSRRASTREKRKQISIAFSQAQHQFLDLQANRRGIPKAEYIRRLIDGIMMGDNTMSRGVDWQPTTLRE